MISLLLDLGMVNIHSGMNPPSVYLFWELPLCWVLCCAGDSEVKGTDPPFKSLMVQWGLRHGSNSALEPLATVYHRAPNARGVVGTHPIVVE